MVIWSSANYLSTLLGGFLHDIFGSNDIKITVLVAEIFPFIYVI